MASSCLLTSSMSSRSVISCLTIEPYVMVKISAFCRHACISEQSAKCKSEPNHSRCQMHADASHSGRPPYDGLHEATSAASAELMLPLTCRWMRAAVSVSVVQGCVRLDFAGDLADKPAVPSNCPAVWGGKLCVCVCARHVDCTRDVQPGNIVYYMKGRKPRQEH